MMHSIRNKIPFRSQGLLCIAVLLASCKAETTQIKSETFYDAMLGQIIYDQHYLCLSDFAGDENLKKIDSAYRHGTISDATFRRLVAALKVKRRRSMPKCAITFHPDLGLYEKPHIISDEDKKDMLYNLARDSIFQQTFNAFKSVELLFTPCGLQASDFNIDFLQIEPPPKNWNILWGSISLSKAIFNSDSTRAVLYYEYHYQSWTAEGTFVFAEKQKKGWKIVKYLTSWQS